MLRTWHLNGSFQLDKTKDSDGETNSPDLYPNIVTGTDLAVTGTDLTRRFFRPIHTKVLS